MESLIFDLRFNGGGYLHQAINIADEFLSKDRLIVYTEGAHSKKRTFYSSSNGLFEKGKLVILVNSSTASASEIVSGAIQDNKRGIILGRRTFGKGLVQQPIMLPDSSELRITTSRYYTPSGKCIQKPYGKDINYHNDIFERIESGELTQNDSLNDNSIFKGGIIPDLYSPLDTLNYSEAINNTIYTGNWRDFCFDYFERNPVQNFTNIKDFNDNFKVDLSLINSYLKENGKNIDQFNNQELVDLEWSVKVELSSYYYSDQSRYILNTYKDNDVKRAIKEIINQSL
jgi:carboxyl-terminal processing protease